MGTEILKKNCEIRVTVFVTMTVDFHKKIIFEIEIVEPTKYLKSDFSPSVGTLPSK